jgi:hypothetical protein
MRPPARSLRLGDPPESWEALGFPVEGGSMVLGGLEIVLTGEGGGVCGLEVEGLEADAPADLPIHGVSGEGPSTDAAGGAVGALAVDHLVVLTADFAGTVDALEAAGLDLRRRREPP